MKKVPCGSCGEPRWPSQHAGAPTVPICRKCRSKAFTHGTTNGYKAHGCRCDECREAQAAAQRSYQSGRKARGLASRSARPRRYSLSREKRMAIFERDEWTCQICSLLLDRLAHWNDPMAPTLDHIVPQSLSESPDHSPSNLRAAHRRCNSSRGNRVEMEQAC